MDWIAWVGVSAGLAGIIFGAAQYLRGRHTDDEADGKRDGVVLTELGYIKSGVDDIKRKQDRQEEQNMQFVARLSAVESSAKQAHKRIDRIEGIEERKMLE